MITTQSDQRVVVVDITGMDSAPIDSNAGMRIVPRQGEVVIDLPSGRVQTVTIKGPVLTKSGNMHATQQRVWFWSSGLDGVKVWPPAEAPDVALDVVNAHASASIR